MRRRHRSGGRHESGNCWAWGSQNRSKRSSNGRQGFILMTRTACSANWLHMSNSAFPMMLNTGCAPIEATISGFAGADRQCGMSRESPVECPDRARTSQNASGWRKPCVRAKSGSASPSTVRTPGFGTGIFGPTRPTFHLSGKTCWGMKSTNSEESSLSGRSASIPMTASGHWQQCEHT